MKKPRISVIVPTLNEELYLPRLLKDISVQSKDPSFEVLVIDGRSEDKTWQVVESFAHVLPIKLISTSRRNVAFQRNLGAAKAKGDYIMFIDADCRIGKRTLHDIEKTITSIRPLVIIPSIVPEKNSYIDTTVFQIANYVAEISQHIGRPITLGACMIFAKSFFTFTGGFSVDSKQDKGMLFSEDTDLIGRVTRSGVRAFFMKKTTVLFSLRRYKKEGRRKVMTKYLLNVIDTLANGKISPTIEYKMGGQYYSDSDVPSSLDQFEKYRKQLKQLRRQLKSFFLD